MIDAEFRVRRGLRVGLLGLVSVMAFTAVATDPADARMRRKRVHFGGGYSPPYAAIMVDANSGQILHANNPDSLRHPASLTKIMTLYMLFEQLEGGKLRLDTPLPVSAHASVQAPSKLGLRPGQSIAVEDAIKALVTKSANDVASVIAEAIAGDEDDFAALMTRKARAIGMTRTTYMNASGLPNSQQVTTARDQATLGRAIQERFPRYYRYFATPTFYYGGRAIRNHNNLLGRVAGVDGIKTGFTNASGFNLVSNLRRGDRHVVGVVLGGTSGRWRDARMQTLLEGSVSLASVRRTSTTLAEARPIEAPAPARRIAAFEPKPAAEPRIAPALTQATQTQPVAIVAAPVPGSAEPIKPVIVQTVAVKRAPVRTAAAAVAARNDDGPATTAVAAPAFRNAAMAPVPMARQQVASAGDDAVFTAALARDGGTAPTRVSTSRGDWIIQVGAFPAENVARDRLKEAQQLAGGMLGAAEPFTERVVRGESTLFRARFAGLDRDRAEAACQMLKKSEIACLALKN